MSTEQPRHMDELLARKRELASHSAAAPELSTRLGELRSWQAARLARTYRDLHSQYRYAPGVDFFLSDLYGPRDLSGRDRDLTRAWGVLKHSLPETALKALERAIELEVLSAELDHAMVAVLAKGAVNEERYASAYRTVGQRDARQRQIDLAIRAGEDLDRTVRRVLIGAALRAARGPAHAAGFGVLQDFLERGYSAFRRMGGAEIFLKAIRERETMLMEALFAGKAAPFAFLETIGGDANA